MLRTAFAAATIIAVTTLGGCNSNSNPIPTARSNFLSTYRNLTKVDENTYRYLNEAALAQYTAFFVPEAHVYPSEDARAVKTSWGDLNLAREYLQQTVINHLSEGGYQVVANPGPDVLEVRLALSDAYDMNNRVGLNIEAELLDSMSTIQIGALVEASRGRNLTLNRFWTEHDAKGIMDGWAQRFIDNLNRIHGR